MTNQESRPSKTSGQMGRLSHKAAMLRLGWNDKQQTTRYPNQKQAAAQPMRHIPLYTSAEVNKVSSDKKPPKGPLLAFSMFPRPTLNNGPLAIP